MSYESAAGTISRINLDKKTIGKRSAGKPHAAFDEAGTGNGRYNVPRQFSTLLVGGVKPTGRRTLRTGGFTLIELLVVIAVISILTAILLPSLKRAREQVKTIYCKNNLKQIGLAFLQYVHDYNGYLPKYRETSWQDAWNYRLTPYLKGRASNIYTSNVNRLQIFICPSDKENVARQPSYSMNANNEVSGAKISHIVHPCIKGLLVEYCVSTLGGGPYWWNYNMASPGGWSGFHYGRSNVLFVDMHVSGPLNVLSSYAAGELTR